MNTTVAGRGSFLLRELLRRDIEARYRGSVLGFLWSFIEPLWQLALFSFVFGMVLEVRVVGESTTSFPIFLFAGLLPWMAMQGALARSTTAMLDHAALIKSHRFPAELFVLTVVLSELIHTALAALLFVAVLGLTGELSPSSLPLLAIAVPLQFALTFGMGLALGTAQVFFRDVRRALGLLLNSWFYVTPIVYPLAQVPARLRTLIELNPLTGLTELYRAALLGGPVPWTTALASLTVCAVLALLIGWKVLSAFRSSIVDEV